MFLFSFQLMNRSIDRWFSPNTSELREDSTRVVLELAQYVTSNARGEAESIAATGAPDLDAAHARTDAFASHRVTLDGGFVLIYGKDRRVLASFPGAAREQFGQPHSLAPRKSRSSEIPIRRFHCRDRSRPALLHCRPAQRRAGDSHRRTGLRAGKAATGSGKMVDRGSAHAPGTQPDHRAHSRKARPSTGTSFASRHSIRATFFLMLSAHHRRGLLLQRLARAVSLQADHAPRRSAGRCHG